MRARSIISHLAAFVAGVIVAGAVVAQAVPGPNQRSRDRYRTLDAFAESLSYILNQYVDPVDERKVIHAAVRGMVDELDAHSAFLPPRRYQRLREDTEGEFAGVGIALGDGATDSAPPIIETVVARSPAARAGIREGDALIAIDGRPTVRNGKASSARSYHSRLRGRAGTRVVLTVLRTGASGPKKLTLVREQVKVPTVDYDLLDHGIGYLKISKFQEATSADTRSALGTIAARAPGKKIGGLILDLRNNPGGLLDQGIRVADLFLDKGTIVTVRGRKGTPVEREVAHAGGTWKGFPMIVLIDQGSASAAEIVAGALQDHDRAVLLGLPSYGKGSVQTFLDLEDGSGLRLTTARYYTPAGRSMEGTGIKPDIQVEAFEGEDIVAGDGEPDDVDPAAPEVDDRRTGDGTGSRATIRDSLAGDLQLRTAYQMLRAELGSKD